MLFAQAGTEVDANVLVDSRLIMVRIHSAGVAGTPFYSFCKLCHPCTFSLEFES